MQDLTTSLIFILAGFSLITIIDAGGSIISRQLNFNYGYFTILSILVYTSIAYFMFEKTNNSLATINVSLLMGFYDGSVGWIISKKLKANYGRRKELAEKMTIAHTILAAIIFSLACGCIGIYLASQ